MAIHMAQTGQETPVINENLWFYVSVMNETGHYRLLLGPYALHADAIAAVDRGAAKAQERDVKAVWYSYGTLSIERTKKEPQAGIFGV